MLSREADLTQFEWDVIDADIHVCVTGVAKLLREVAAAPTTRRWVSAGVAVAEMDTFLRILDDAIAKAQGKPISVPYVAPPLEVEGV